ncbi:MAG: N-acetylmuramic acid 6-phosphate etherase [Candidatus Gastranaerophilales bacterium]|nr:N-acetylmuramic acid 6-phosphate etherase [Candidatus Gastranaerophilales bacterium]
MYNSDTEKLNQNTANIDISATADIVQMINNEDFNAVKAVQKCLPQIAKAVDIIADNFEKGGRLIYFGAGTSGRLGVLDASECPPTFSVPETMVVGVIAGGNYALRHAIEGAEDKPELAREDFERLNITENDTVTAISASGNAAYVVEVLKLAKEKNCKTVAVTSNKNALTKDFADIFICAETGAEAISGSTRMKAGTAQKLILNMLTTASMVKIGKVYKNYMIDVKPTNEKLKIRAAKIVSMITGAPEEKAKEVLLQNGYKVKQAILKIRYNLDTAESEKLIAENKGILRKIFEQLDK